MLNYFLAGREVGIDMGLKELAILSNGIKFQIREQQLAEPAIAQAAAKKTIKKNTW